MPRYGKAHIFNEGNLLDKEIKLRQARKEVLDMLIEERLLQRVGQRFGITVEDAEVDGAIEQMKQRTSMRKQCYRNLLRRDSLWKGTAII